MIPVGSRRCGRLLAMHYHNNGLSSILCVCVFACHLKMTLSPKKIWKYLQNGRWTHTLMMEGDEFGAQHDNKLLHDRKKFIVSKQSNENDEMWKYPVNPFVENSITVLSLSSSLSSVSINCLISVAFYFPAIEIGENERKFPASPCSECVRSNDECNNRPGGIRAEWMWMTNSAKKGQQKNLIAFMKRRRDGKIRKISFFSGFYK